MSPQPPASRPRGGAQGDRPATTLHCRRHQEVPAQFGCDGCGAPLCAECIEEGHRLLFCRLCGERALPLADNAPATTTARREARRLAAPYSWQEALGYVVRGQGRYLYFGYVALMTILDLISGNVPGFRLAIGAPRMLVAILLPAMLFSIVRSTAAGENELPDWPDFLSPVDRLREWLWALGVTIGATLPLVALLSLSRCGPLALLTGQAGAGCLALLLLGMALSAPLGLFALGATGNYESGWLSFRIDLHLRALVATGGEGLRTVGLVTAVGLGGEIVSFLLGWIPLLGGLIAHALGAWALFTGPHLVGLLFRRRASDLDAIYVD